VGLQSHREPRGRPGGSRRKLGGNTGGGVHGGVVATMLADDAAVEGAVLARTAFSRACLKAACTFPTAPSAPISPAASRRLTASGDSTSCRLRFLAVPTPPRPRAWWWWRRVQRKQSSAAVRLSRRLGANSSCSALTPLLPTPSSWREIS